MSPDVRPIPRNYEIDVNGAPCTVSVMPATPLLGVLRDDLGLTGTKEPCARGECGGCTVLLDGCPILSCITIVEDVVGAVTTIEGLAAPHVDIRQAFADRGAFQCGYCTPGQIVRAVALLNDEWPDEPHAVEPFVRHAISGNICRCTGYVGIVDAIMDVARARGKLSRA